MTVKLSPLAGAGWQFFTDDGVPLAGGKIYTYTAGTTTPQATYTTVSGGIAHANPIILDANGRVNEIWLTEGVSYKFFITDANDVTIGTYDNLDGINDVAALINAVYVNLADTNDVAKGDALIGFKQANLSGVYGGAIGQTVHRKLQEIVSVFDFMTLAQIADVQAGTKLIDVRTPINNAFAAVIGNGGGTLYFPKGTYYITNFIGNTTGTANPISLAVIGEPGTVIDCNPSVGANYCVDMRFTDLRYAIVENLTLECNNKVATGLRVRSGSTTERCQLVYINNVRTFDLNIVNDASITTNANGIIVDHGNLGINLWITNCYVANVSRDKPGGCSGIVAQDSMTILVQNNAIFNVTHNGQTLIDADGIKIFSNNDAGEYYRQSTCEVSNNRIVNCNGRMIKLQTDGVCVVSGNMMALTNVMELITNWKGVDSQVASATIINNKIQILAQYTGGSSAAFFTLQCLTGANIRETNQVFVQRVQDNDIYVANLAADVSYGVTIGADYEQEVTRYYIIKNNVFGRDTGINFTSGNAAVGRFVYVTGTGTLATWEGFMVLDVSGNRVASAAGTISMQENNNEDYADKWFFYIYDNFIYSYQGEVTFVTSGGAVPASNIPYTSTMMVRGNSSGNEYGGLSVLPLNVSKLLSGSEVEVGDGSTPAMTNVPANYRNGRIKKNGQVIDVQTVSGGTAYHYISTDAGSNYYAV